MNNAEFDDPDITPYTLTIDVHESIRESFVPLPSDPFVKLTPEQMEALFPHPEAFREMVEITLRKLQSQSSKTSDAA